SPAMGPGFGPPGGPGGARPGGRGPGGPPGPGARPSGADLDPLIGMNDTRKPLRSRLLAVPALKERYLKYVRTIAEEQLDWKKLGPTVAAYRTLIEKEVEADTRKLYSLAAFKSGVADRVESERGPGGGPGMGLRAFAESRRNYLLKYSETRKERRER